MREQYTAEIQHNTYRKGEWCRVTPDEVGKLYFNTEKEAEDAIKRATEYFNGLSRSKVVQCGSVGITTPGDRKVADAMAVVKSRIRVRLVSDWQTLTEE